METVSSLLLPLGMWLILSASAPTHLQRRLAAITMIALGVGTLSFVGFGYALMFGAPAGGAQPAWVFAGTRGFLLQGALDEAGLAQFIGAWPLVTACAILFSGALAARARTIAVAGLVALVAGIAFPIAGCWMWASGWLQALGANANLGDGAIDLGRIAVVALVAGAGAAAWIGALPRRTVRGPGELPEVHFPARAVAGVLCVLIAGIPGGAPGLDAVMAMGHFVNISLAVSAAILTAGAYTLFTTRNADVMTASRAALAAVIIASSGAALMPQWAMLALGLVCGLLATVGYYAVREHLRLADDTGMLSCALAPAAIGMLATGVLGVAAQPGAGQFVAQAAAVSSIAALAWTLVALALTVAARARAPLFLPEEIVVTTSPVAAADAATAAAVGTEWTTSLPDLNVTYTRAQETTAADATDAADGKAVPVQIAAAEPARSEGGILAWLRRSTTTPETPKQPRKTAYPYRVGGRRLATRPLAPGASSATASPENRETPGDELT